MFNVLSSLICVQTICIDHHQTTKLPIIRKKVNMYIFTYWKFSFLFVVGLFFSKSAFFEKFIQEYTISIKQLGSRSGQKIYQPRSGSKQLFANVVARLHLTICLAWSRSKLFANVISRHFVGPDLDPNCLQMWSADNSLSGLIWIRTVCKWNQFANVISRRHFVGPDLDRNCLQL